MEKIRKHIIFSGHVQGVGFRWHAQNAASAYGLTGWVENLFDGTVEMEVQGTAPAIEKMLLYLGRARFVRIESIEQKNIPLQEESSFRVRGY
ncbi:MAG: acylphosphatase [Lachnospiraceae bacterium]|nr:acylphosphatase [Lachnospiraceae bacterium]